MSNNFRFAQLQPFSLAGAGAVAGAISITLKSMTDIDGNALTMAGTFGSVGYGTLEPGNNTLEEQISFTGLVNNANGTVTLSGIHSVAFVYPYTATSGLLKTHAGSTSFVISNTSGFYNSFAALDDDETVNGTWSFTAVPNTAQDPVNGNDIARRSWVLSVVNGGAVSQSQVIVAGTAGETVAAGNPVYLKAADGRWWKATGATAATVNNVQLGIAQGAGTAGVNITSGVLIAGVDTHQSGGAAGAIGYVSDTSTIATSSGTTERALGQFLSSTNFELQPDFYYVPTAIQKVRLVNGTNVQVFTTSGTWTKPTGVYNWTDVYAIGGGAGGAAGGYNSSNVSNAGGGAGGAAGMWSRASFPTSSLGSTETVTVGTGGATVAGRNTSGNGASGNAGSDSSFGSWLTAKGGQAGSGGGNATSTSGAAVAGRGMVSDGISIAGSATLPGASGKGADSSTANGTAGIDAVGFTPTGGGGGANTAGSEGVGLAGGAQSGAATLAGGAAGAVHAAGGNGQAATTGIAHGGTGGGGGGSGKDNSGGAGGTGGKYGGGGGGGGGSVGTGTSGAGGAGGDGIVIAISW